MTQTLLKVASDFESALAAFVNLGDTTASLSSTEDTDGNNLTDGLYGFTIDNNTDHKEYIVATLTGTALTAVTSVSDQGVATSGFAKFHRQGAVVEITDWAALLRVVNILNGTTNLDGGTPLGYDSAPALGSANQLATVQYVLDHINGGAVSFNATVIAGMAGETVVAGNWVYLKESDGRWYKTAATSLATSYGVKVGMALGAGTAGNSIASGVFLSGLETTQTYAAHTAYYLSDTSGALSTSAGTNSVLVGISDGNSKLVVSKINQSYINAMDGSSGTPSSANKYLTADNVYTSSEDVIQNTQNGSTVLGAANTSGNRNKVAQSFVPTRTKMRGVKLYKAADSGTFTGTVSIAIQADSAGSPSGSDLITTTIANASWAVLSAAASFMAEFSSDLAVVPGTTYWIVATTSTADSTNHPNLGISSTSVYANGILKYDNTTDGWVTTTTDLYFSTLNGIRSQVAETDATTGMVPSILVPVALIDMDTTTTTVSNSNVETTVYTKILPASALHVNAGISIRGILNAQIRNGAQMTIVVKMNGSAVATIIYGMTGTPALLMSGAVETYILNTSLTAQKYIASSVLTAQSGNAAASNTNATAVTSYNTSGTSSIDVTGGDVLLTITCKNSETNVGASFSYLGTVLSKISI